MHSSSVRQQFLPFKPSWLNKLRSPLQSSGYYVLLSRSAQGFMSTLSPYQKTVLSQMIYSLSGNPRPGTARHMKNSTDKYYIPETNTGFSVSYEVFSGKVYVTSIVPDPDARGIHKEVPGLYHVKETPDGWDYKRIENGDIKTEYAAVNGQSNALERAVALMPKHVQHAYGKTVKEFTLFHNPSDGGLWDTYESFQDKCGFTTGVSKMFAKVLQDAQAAGGKLGWIAHSQGGIIFRQAVKYHLDNGGGTLANHSVKFYAGANNRNKTNIILRQAGIKIGANDYVSHPYDMVPQLIGGNAKSISSVIGSVLHSPWVLFGSEKCSPHTLPYDGMDNYVRNMPAWYRLAFRLF